jgi:hypothetical protein
MGLVDEQCKIDRNVFGASLEIGAEADWNPR